MDFGSSSIHASDFLEQWGQADNPVTDYALSSSTKAIIQNLRPQASNITGAPVPVSRPRKPSTEEQLFQARAAVKIYTAQVAMRMDPAWRDQLFRQIDSLLDIDEWDDADRPLTTGSYATFMKVLFLLLPGRRPGLALSAGGNLLAVWSNGKNRLTIECMADDEVRWVLAYELGEKIERTAGVVGVDRILDHLGAFELDRWFGTAVPESA